MRTMSANQHVDPVRGPDVQQIRFAIDGVDYDIELDSLESARFRELLGPYVARAVAAPDRRRHLQEIRRWARANGLPISAHGRIPRSVQEAYDTVHDL